MKHIDDVQPLTVDEHFKALINDEQTNVIDYKESEDLNPSDLPEWYDDKLFKAGQRYYNTNVYGLSLASLIGLLAVLAIPSILRVLIYTKQSGTPCTAFRRYLETIFHTRAWYKTDVKDENSDWYRTTNTVRWKHSSVSRRCLRDGIGGITHRDMALTQFGFVGYVLLSPRCLGLTNSPEDREGFNHFWRVVGHMLGISDRLNVCRKTAEETEELCKILQTEVFAKYFKEVPANFIEMAEAMLDGLWSIDMAVDKHAILALAYKLNGVTYPRPIPLYSWINYQIRETVYRLMGVPVIGDAIRIFMNHFLNASYWIMGKFPLVAWLCYGPQKSKINMYPKHR